MASQTGKVDQGAFLKAFVDLEEPYSKPLPGHKNPKENIARGSKGSKKTKKTLT
tara:strand:- start:474 stop:635 length:162 start_codon:yes stop_codon:yes gene_type:complete